MNLSARALPGVASAPAKAAAFPRPAFAPLLRTATSQPVGLSSSSFSPRLLLGSAVCRERRTVLTRFNPGDKEARELELEAGVTKAYHPTLFTLKQHCAYGQQWRVCGNLPELGKWDPVEALPMTWGPGDLWYAVVDLPEGQHCEYKHVLYDEHKDECFWCQDGIGSTTNMALDVLPSMQATLDEAAAIVGGPGAPNVRHMVAKLEEERAAALLEQESAKALLASIGTDQRPPYRGTMEHPTILPEGLEDLDGHIPPSHVLGNSGAAPQRGSGPFQGRL